MNVDDEIEIDIVDNKVCLRIERCFACRAIDGLYTSLK